MRYFPYAALITAICVPFVILIGCDLRVDEPKPPAWDAFWVLTTYSGSSTETYSRYTRPQCEEAKAVALAQRIGAVCVPVPLKDITAVKEEQKHGHDHP